MRQIKFRAWHKKDGMMYFGDCDFHMTLNGDWYSASDSPIETQIKLNEAGYSFMQFTGLKDKNGKEIYEGDIVRDHPNLDGGEVKLDDVFVSTDPGSGYTGVLGWGVFGGSYYDGEPLSSEFEVIGNIYENPNLLK